MVRHTEGLHHYHVRKRIHQKHEPYPHPDKWKNFVDKAIFVVGAFGPIMSIPQLLKIWIEKDATGVSIITWEAFLFIASFWLIYGIMHKEKPIIFTQSLWILTEILIVIGILIYG